MKQQGGLENSLQEEGAAQKSWTTYIFKGRIMTFLSLNSRSGLWRLNRSLVGGLADHCITCSKHSHRSYRSVKSERNHFSCFFFFHLPYLGQIHADTEWDRSRYEERLRCTESNKIIADGELRRLSVDCVRCPWEAPRCRDDCAQGNWEAWA